MEFSKIYYELYDDIANYRVLTEEQIKKLESLTPAESFHVIHYLTELHNYHTNTNYLRSL